MIIDMGLVQWGASKEEAKVILGGRSTMATKGDRGVHMPPSGLHVQCGNMECPKEDLGCSAIPRTMEGDEAHYTALLLGAPSLQAAGCSIQAIWNLPRAWVVLCILQLMMAMGRLLGEFVDREARGVTPSLGQDLQVLVSERCASWSV